MCPLPWLEEAEDVQYNFDDVFIPLRTIDIDIQQKDDGQPGPSDKRHKKRKIDDSIADDLDGRSNVIDDEELTGDLSEPLDLRLKKRRTDEQPGPSSSRDDRGQTDDQPGPSGSRDDRGQTDDQPGPSDISKNRTGKKENLHSSRYKCNDFMLLTQTIFLQDNTEHLVH